MKSRKEREKALRERRLEVEKKIAHRKYVEKFDEQQKRYEEAAMITNLRYQLESGKNVLIMNVYIEIGSNFKEYSSRIENFIIDKFMHQWSYQSWTKEDIKIVKAEDFSESNFACWVFYLVEYGNDPFEADRELCVAYFRSLDLTTSPLDVLDEFMQRIDWEADARILMRY